MGRLHRNLQLDVLRGIAILMVLSCHGIFVQTPTWDAPLIRAGWSGVDLFFVVSGFLISGLLFSEYRKTGGIHFRRFAVRRAFKIYPAFYALVLLTVAAHFVEHPFSLADPIWPRLLHDVFFLQSYWAGTSGHFWSLAVEEHFYILLPLALFFLMRRAGRRTRDPFQSIPNMFLVVAATLLAARLWNAQSVAPFDWRSHPSFVPRDWQTYVTPTHLRLDSLFFGVVISYWYHFHRERFSRLAARYRYALLITAAALLSPLFVISQYDPWMYTYGFAAAYLGYGCLLTGFLHISLDRASKPLLLAFRALGYIGTHSYSIYLWHLAWLNVVGYGRVRVAPLLIFNAGAIGIGIAAAKLVETPALRLRDRVFPRVTRPLEEPSQTLTAAA